MEVISSNNNSKGKSNSLRFEVHYFRSSHDLELYNSLLGKFPANPFAKKELFRINEDEKIGFITMYSHANELLVLFLFLCRKIIVDGKESGYWDTISPYGFAGPLLGNRVDIHVMKQFWAYLDDWYAKNNVVTEFIRFNFDENIQGYSGTLVPTLKMVSGKIRPEDEQWINFDKKVRNNVRKAISYKLKSKIYHQEFNDTLINTFHQIYQSTMDRHNAESRYHYEIDYFKNLIYNNPESCVMAFVYYEERAISTELLLLSDQVIYSYLGGTLEEFFYTRPNDFLKWSVLQWGRQNGFTDYFLGGGREDNDNLYSYKKKFFTHDKDKIFYTGRKIILPNVFDFLVSLNPYSNKGLGSNFFPLYRFRQ